MIKDIVRDPVFLGHASREAQQQDYWIADDLVDTLMANRERCVGMAANMIGQWVRIIVIMSQGKPMVMINPVIEKTVGKPYETEEGCLSLPGERKTKRFSKIQVSFQDRQGKKKQRTFSGFEAQIVQHEIDHCNGILI